MYIKMRFLPSGYKELEKNLEKCWTDLANARILFRCQISIRANGIPSSSGDSERCSMSCALNYGSEET